MSSQRYGGEVAYGGEVVYGGECSVLLVYEDKFCKNIYIRFNMIYTYIGINCDIMNGINFKNVQYINNSVNYDSLI